ncbi:MAG: aromatic acid exporter family protein [Proteocatella sp.]
MPLMFDMDKPIPRPGMRIIKTSIATFLCFFIDYIRGVNEPIYAVISAILCMQKDIDNSWIVSKNRIIGTFIGGVFGVVTLLMINNIAFLQVVIIRFSVASFVIIPLLYTITLMGKQGAASVTCVVYASIVILHVGSNQVLYYAISRMLDTTVGIVVSLIVNVMFTRKIFRKMRENKEK